MGNYSDDMKQSDMTAGDFSTAMRKALEGYHGSPGSGDEFEPRKTGSGSEDGITSTIGGRGGRKTKGTGDSNLEKEVAAFSGLTATLKEGAEFYSGAVDALEASAGPVLAQYNALQKAYGGISIDLDNAVGSSKAVIDRLGTMKEFYYDVGEAGTDMAKELGFSSNMVNDYFSDEAKAFNESEAILSRLVEQHSQFTNQIEKETLFKLPAYTQALGVTSKEVAGVLEREMIRTGTTSTKMLDDVARFAEELHKTTGVPLKSISANAIKIRLDTQRLGDVTAEEATRMAASIGQLGQTYDSLTGAMDKFQEFGSSAETAGLISQITGGAVNLDAQELMYLASQEQDKFLPYLREAFLAGNFDKDAFLEISKAEQRQLMTAIGQDRESFQSLIDRNRQFDPAQIDAALETAKERDEDVGKILERQLELAPKAFETAKEQAEEFRAKAMVPLEKQLLKNAEAQGEFNSAIRNNVELTDSAGAANRFETTLKRVEAATDAGKDAIKEQTKIGSAELLEIYDKAADKENKAVAPAEDDIMDASNTSTKTQQTNILTPPPSPSPLPSPPGSTVTPSPVPVATPDTTAAVTPAEEVNEAIAQQQTAQNNGVLNRIGAALNNFRDSFDRQSTALGGFAEAVANRPVNVVLEEGGMTTIVARATTDKFEAKNGFSLGIKGDKGRATAAAGGTGVG